MGREARGERAGRPEAGRPGGQEARSPPPCTALDDRLTDWRPRQQPRRDEGESRRRRGETWATGERIVYSEAHLACRSSHSNTLRFASFPLLSRSTLIRIASPTPLSLSLSLPSPHQSVSLLLLPLTSQVLIPLPHLALYPTRLRLRSLGPLYALLLIHLPFSPIHWLTRHFACRFLAASCLLIHSLALPVASPTLLLLATA